MEVKSFAATLGLGMAAGAAAVLMMPNRSRCYRAADEAAHSIKRTVSHAMDDLMD